MKGYARYEKLVAEWATQYIQPLMRAKQRGVDVNKQDHSFYDKLFLDCVEITYAIESLELSQILISLAPPRSKKISREDYIRYHINTYLQEVYILKERLISYATKLMRVYAKTPKKANVSEIVKPLCKLVSSKLKDLVDTRGSHVHMYRYRDAHLDRLARYSLAARYDEELVPHEKYQYKTVQLIWKGRVKENNKATMGLLDIYFDVMFEVVTDEGKIIVPNT